MQDKLQILHHNNEVKYKYILFDKWFSSIKNLLFIEEELNKKFVCPIKSNRLLLKPFSIFGYMSLLSYFNLKYKSNFNITKI